MRKKRTEYNSQLDALIAISKCLNTRENEHSMESEAFYDQYKKGQLSDDMEHVEWANDYKHYLELHHELEEKLKHVA